MLKSMDEKAVSQLFILTQVGTASETSWWRGRRASSGIDKSRWLFEESRISFLRGFQSKLPPSF